MKEFDLLAQIYEQQKGMPGDRVLIGPGDDMASVLLRAGSPVLAAVDQLVAGRHFRLDATPMNLVGRKAVARSLSDIAAMAARPVAALAAVVIPQDDFTEDQALELFAGMRELAAEYDCPLVGGDIAFGDGPLVCTVTVLAEPGPTGAVVRRSGAQAGDLIYVTGSLGGAVNSETGLGRHLTFAPRIALAAALVADVPVHAMIDISDGLGRDLDHIAEMSGIVATIEAERLPLTAGCDWRQALSDGEDYELCFTVAAEARVPDELLDVPISCVGQCEKVAPLGAGEKTRPRTAVITPDGRTLDAADFGWEHGR